ncbi:TerD family protein [Leptospira bandrabouensis]|uniref:TerD family protein n=1 Tax=Leptospira bandrabouensis TaxID=2484903 RepID=UPI001EE7F6D4|nr:TerD family protein [Leptospira bandrabouensis]MCG6146600.1 TerD family protein [Leptospira bandrabouensis]MCG6161932.1 TerD family protein [Leptospira bandrabouensis]MCG6166181.1 TerD family protein [Leptospira bandrabouensis]
MNNLLYLKLKNKIIIDYKENQLDDIYIFSLLKNIESLGYTFSEQIIKILKTFSVGEIEEFHNRIVDDLKTILGTKFNFQPMYPNFPKQVMDANETELYLNATMHYLGDWFGVRILPKYTIESRESLKDNLKLKVITLGSIDDFNLIFTRLLKSKIAISEADKECIEWYIKNYQDNILKLFPDEIPLKENIAFIGAKLMKYTSVSEKFLKDSLKTSTDVLRLVTAISEGDVSLTENTKFKNIKKKDRRLILLLLENCKEITEDMIRHKEKWKRIGEKLHPFEYKSKFPKCFEAFDIIRNDKPFETFYSKVERFIREKDFDSLVSLLKKRPGEYARRLDTLIRLSKDSFEIISNFEQIADKISTPILLQMLNNFKFRNEKQDLRIFFPKGNISKVQAIENRLSNIDEGSRQKIVEICRKKLIDKFAKLKPLGKVYLDENLKNYTVPFALRSASKALKTISRGSQLDLPKGNTVRFFIWWKDGKGRTDIDLSAVALDQNHNFLTTIAYFNLKEMGGYHSGDITSAPEGASEFIDIDIEQFLRSGTRYIVMSINSFTQQPFCDLPECFAGFMIRQHPNSGEIYEPRTIENKFDVTANTKICIPMIIDLEVRKVIWTDISLTTNIGYNNNVLNNMSSIALMSKAMTSMRKTSLYDLFQLHIEARGERIEKKTDADFIFSVNDGITPLETEKIIADFL